MSTLSNLDYLKAIAKGQSAEGETSRFHYPPTIAQTLGFNLIDVGPATCVIELKTDVKRHANPMGTIHGGVLCDIADAAIGTAHATVLQEGESFTSLDLQINFFRPVWDDVLLATVKPVHLGKTVSRYVCDISNQAGKVVAQVVSSVMTLRGTQANSR